MLKQPKSEKLSHVSLFENLDDEYTKSFRRDPTPALIELPPKFQMYKWAGTSRIDAKTGHRVRNTLFKNDGTASPYWAPWAAMPAHNVPGFADLRILHRNTKGSVGTLNDFSRNSFAVSEDFGEMNSIVKSELLKPCWAFLGACALQLFSNGPRENRKGFFTGGGFQLLVPGLRAEDIYQF